MPLLNNSKWELFAQALAKGFSAEDAYAEAGYSANSGNARRLKGNEAVSNRVAELLSASAERAGITIDRVRDEIAKVAFANMQDYMRVTTGGDPFVYLSDLTGEQAAAIGEFTVEDFKEGRGEDARDVRRIRFKLHPKLNALEQLGKHLGMFKEKIEHTGRDGGPIETKEISDADRVKALAVFLAKTKDAGK